MARNEEKHFARLNRLQLQQQKEEQLKKNPPRPKLVNLHTVGEIKQWLPAILRDIEFNLAQSQVPCYPERKIREFEAEITHLKREYHAFVRRLKELDPNIDIVPWTERAYTNRKRPHQDKLFGDGEIPAKQLNAQQDGSGSSTRSWSRLSLPILDSKVETLYREERVQQPSQALWNFNEEMADKPLEFTHDKNDNHQASCRDSSFHNVETLKCKNNSAVCSSPNNLDSMISQSDPSLCPDGFDEIICECSTSKMEFDVHKPIVDNIHNNEGKNLLGLSYEFSSDEDTT